MLKLMAPFISPPLPRRHVVYIFLLRLLLLLKGLVTAPQVLVHLQLYRFPTLKTPARPPLPITIAVVPRLLRLHVVPVVDFVPIFRMLTPIRPLTRLIYPTAARHLCLYLHQILQRVVRQLIIPVVHTHLLWLPASHHQLLQA